MASIQDRLNAAKKHKGGVGGTELGKWMPPTRNPAPPPVRPTPPSLQSRLNAAKASGKPAAPPTPKAPVAPRSARVSGYYSPSNTPNFDPATATLPWNRATGIIRGAFGGSGAGALNAGGVAADTAARVVDSFTDGGYDSAQKRIKRYRKFLIDGKTDDGSPLTEEARQHYIDIIKRDMATVERTKPTGTMEERRPVLTGIRDSLYQGADETAAKAQQETARAKEGLGKMGKFGVDVAQAGLQMGLDAATGGLPAMFVRAAGGAAQEARLNGADFYDSLEYGLKSGGLSVATEKIANVAAPFKAVFGKGVLDKAVSGAVAKMNGSKLGKLALSMLSEGGEEFIESVFQPVLQRATWNPNARFNLEDALHDAAVGAVLGGLGSAGEVITAGKKPVKPTTPPVTPQTAPVAPPPPVDTPVSPNPVQSVVTPTATVSENTTVPPVTPVTPVTEESSTVVAENATTTPGAASAIDKGKRIAQADISQDEFNSIANREDVAMDADNRVYKVDPAQHIDSRDPSHIRNPHVNSFQYDHPELHHYYTPAAEELLLEFSAAQKGGQTEYGRGEYDQIYAYRTKRNVTPRIARLLDSGMTYDRIEAALDAIIKDKGADNYADAKRVEMVLDDMLSNGYNDGTRFVPANQAYIEAKTYIPGNKATEYGHGLDDIDPLPEDTAPQSEANPSMGAADKDFDGGYAEFQSEATSFHPINEAAAERTANEQGRAETEVPTKNPRTEKDIVKTASTIVNSPLTSNEFAEEKERAIMEGRYDAIPITDAEANDAAQETIRQDGDYHGAANRFISKVENGQSVGKMDMAEAIAAYNYAIQAKDFATAFDLVDGIVQSARTSAQFVQAVGLFNKMTPEGKLMVLRRIANRKNRTNTGKPNVSYVTDEDIQAIVDAASAQRDDALGIIQALIDDFSSGKSKEDVGWVEALAAELSKRAESTVRTRKPRERTVYELISSDLTKFMRQYLSPAKVKTQKRTAAETLADFFNNRQEYARAWNQARETLRQKYKDNPQMLGKLEEFLQGSITYSGSGSDAVMMRAIADAALEQDVRLKEWAIRGEYDAANLAAEIASDVIRASGASTEADIRMIEDAAKRFVENKMESGKSASEYFEGDTRKAMHDIGVRMSDIIKQGARTKAELAGKITKLLTSRYHVSPDGAEQISNDIADQFQGMVEEAARNKLTSIFKDRPERVQKTIQQRFTELGNMGAFTDPNFAVKGASRVFGTDGISVDQDLATKYLSAETDKARQDAWEAIIADMAEQIPSTFREKADAIRYLSMLANPTTHIRNTLGNAMQFFVRKVKNLLGTVLEKVVVKDKANRTKAILFGKPDKALKDFAREQYESDKSASLGEGKYQDGTSAGVSREIEEQRQKQVFGKTFLGKAIQSGINLNSKALEGEDILFNRSAYIDSFAQALKAKGITAEKARENPNAPGVAAAREYAVTEAQKATYRNTTALSEALSRIGGYKGDNAALKAGSFAFNAIMPFRKTPANVMTTGMKYSPAGLLKAVTYDAYQVKKGNMSATDMVDDLSAGLTGTGVMRLGMYLAAEGLLAAHAGGDDDKKEQAYRRQLGEQDYALTIGDSTYTIDWASPAAMPLMAGAAFIEKSEDKQGAFLGALDAMWDGATDMLLETSMLSSLDDLLSGVSYAENKPQYVMSSVASDYMSQFVPTALGRVASTMDDTVRKSFVEQGAGQAAKDLGFFQQGIRKKVPGLRQTLQPSVDLWGREVSNGSATERLVQNFISPGYFRSRSEDAVDKEILRLDKHSADGGDSVIPSAAAKEVPQKHKNSAGEWVSDEPRKLTAEEYTRYAKNLGQTRHKMLNNAFKSDWYKGMTDSEKTDYIGKVYEYSKATADSKFGTPITSEWMKNVPNAREDIGVSPEEFIHLTVKYGARSFSGSSYEKMKSAHRIDMSVNDFFRFKDESKDLLHGKSRNGKERSNDKTDKDEVRLWAKRNGYTANEDVLMKIINSSW